MRPGLMTSPRVSFFTSSLGLASSFGLASSLGLFSGSLFSSVGDCDCDCGAARISTRGAAKQTSNSNRISNLKTRNLGLSRFTAPPTSRLPGTAARLGLSVILPLGQTKTRQIRDQLQDSTWSSQEEILDLSFQTAREEHSKPSAYFA